MLEHTTSEPPQKTFTCQLCDLSSPFTYYGMEPANIGGSVYVEIKQNAPFSSLEIAMPKLIFLAATPMSTTNFR